MIFCGDFVFPHFTNVENFVLDLSDSFLKESKTINFESLIVKESDIDKYSPGKGGLYSSPFSVDILKKLNTKCVGLANNHITDYPYPIEDTKKYLLDHCISSIGAGSDIYNASKPFYYIESGQKYAVINFGWSVIGCDVATKRKQGVAPFRFKTIINSIENVLFENKDIRIILFLHYGFEFSFLPQPGHKNLFHYIIDKYNQVSAIFSHHSHIIQPFEIYKEVPIFYGLGNFYLPIMKYPNVNISNLFSNEKFFRGICVKYSGNFEDVMIYHLKQSSYKIQELFSENITDQKHLIDLSINSKNNIDLSLYETNMLFLPKYKSINNPIEIFIKDSIVKIRHKIIKAFNFLKIKKPYNSK